MKTEITVLTALLFLGSELMTRVAVQGFEQALFSAVMGWTMAWVKGSSCRS
jgi:hypothetical protein